MGWSCTAAAGKTMDKLTAACIKQTGSQNVFKYGGKEYMWEISGKEQDDGSITGTVLEFLPGGYVKKVSGLRIEPDGTITRGTGLKSLLETKEPKKPEKKRPKNPAGIPRWSPYYPGRK